MSSDVQLTPYQPGTLAPRDCPSRQSRVKAKAANAAPTHGAANPPRTLRRAPRISNKERNGLKLHRLTLDVNALKQELRDLAVRQSLFQTRALYTPHASDGSVMKTVAHYFVVFRRGYPASEHTQPKYLGAIVAPDFSVGVTGLRVDTLLEQWRRYTDYFAIREFTTPAMSLVVDDVEQTCVVRASSRFRGVLTRLALEMIFPAVLRDRELAERLLDKEIDVPVLFHLHFDRDGRVTRHDSDVDFFEVLATLLQDSVRAAAIMGQALVADEGMIEAGGDHEAQLEPAEQLARTKRARVRIASLCDATSDKGDDETAVSEAPLSSWGRKRVDVDSTSPMSPSMEPDSEVGTDLGPDDVESVETFASRHAVSFLLS